MNSRQVMMLNSKGLIPLAGPWQYDDKNAAESLVSDWQDKLKQKHQRHLEFQLNTVIPKSFENVRIRGISLSAGHKLGEDQALSLLGPHRSWAALVFPPDEEVQDAYRLKPYENVVTIKRSPAVLGKIAVFRAESAAPWYSGESIWNVDPRNGTWKIVIEPLANIFAANDPYIQQYWPRAYSVLVDMKLHLKLVARPKSDPHDWTREFGR